MTTPRQPEPVGRKTAPSLSSTRIVVTAAQVSSDSHLCDRLVEAGADVICVDMIVRKYNPTVLYHAVCLTNTLR
jgi:hypothetical protein